MVEQLNDSDVLVSFLKCINDLEPCHDFLHLNEIKTEWIVFASFISQDEELLSLYVKPSVKCMGISF